MVAVGSKSKRRWGSKNKDKDDQSLVYETGIDTD